MSDREKLIEAMARAVRAVGPNGFPDEYATAALAAIEAAGARLVSVEATEDMLDAPMSTGAANNVWQATNIYRAMIAASPYAPGS